MAASHLQLQYKKIKEKGESESTYDKIEEKELGKGAIHKKEYKQKHIDGNEDDNKVQVYRVHHDGACDGNGWCLDKFPCIYKCIGIKCNTCNKENPEWVINLYNGKCLWCQMETWRE